MAVGPSRDRTREIAAELAAAGRPRLRVVDNPERRTPHALNLGDRGRPPRHPRPGRRPRRADRRLHRAGRGAAGGDRRRQRRRGHGRPGRYPVRGGRGAATPPVRARGQPFHLADVAGRPGRDRVPRRVQARGGSAGRRRLRRDHAPGPGLGAQLPPAASGARRLVLPGAAGHLPTALHGCARWPSRCTTRASGAARSSGVTPTPPTPATWRRRRPWSAIARGHWPAVLGRRTRSRLLRAGRASHRSGIAPSWSYVTVAARAACRLPRGGGCRSCWRPPTCPGGRASLWVARLAAPRPHRHLGAIARFDRFKVVVCAQFRGRGPVGDVVAIDSSARVRQYVYTKLGLVHPVRMSSRRHAAGPDRCPGRSYAGGAAQARRRGAGGHARGLRRAARDRYQIITEHPVGHIIAEDTGLGFERSDGRHGHPDLPAGPEREQKKAAYAQLADRLEADCGVRRPT